MPSYNNNIIQQTNSNSNSSYKIYSTFELLSVSIYGTLKTLAYIFSYTVIFSLIPTILISNLNLSQILKAVTIGIFEISNGIYNISLLEISLNYKLILTSFILSFSSLMIIMQIFTFVNQAKVKLKDLIKFKLLQGVFSSLITYIILQFIYTPVVAAYLSQDKLSFKTYILPSTMYLIALVITIIFISILFRKKRHG